MNIVTIGKWKIAVDIEETKAFYTNFECENSQANRNFAEYCKTLSAEEKGIQSQVSNLIVKRSNLFLF